MKTQRDTQGRRPCEDRGRNCSELQAKDCQEPPEANEKAGKDSSLELLEEA